jgi:hypothetical protein
LNGTACGLWKIPRTVDLFIVHVQLPVRVGKLIEYIASERALFTSIGNFGLWRLAVIASILLLLEWSPLLALLPVGMPLISTAGGGMILLSTITHLVSNRWMGRPFHEPFFWFMAAPVYFYAFIRAGVLGIVRGGIIWRGTFYPTKELKKGRRVTL